MNDNKVRGLSMLALVGTLGFGLSGLAQADEAPTPQLPSWTQKPCQMEDSVNCFWNAGDMGNGGGHSFIVRKVPGSKGMICVFYAEKKFARTHDYCS